MKSTETQNAAAPATLTVEVIWTGTDGKTRNQSRTVAKVGELEEHCSHISRFTHVKSFRLGDMVGTYPTNTPGDLTAFVAELNRISRFGKNENATSKR